MDDRARHQWIAAHILPHEAEVRGWLRRYVRTLVPADIDDLVQESYSRLWRAEQELDRIGSGRSYFFAVVRNLLLENARRARIVPMERLGEIETLRLPSEEPGPERRISARQELERLERIIETLPEQARTAFRLQKFRGFSQREIAAEMNISEKTVEKHLGLALKLILDALQEDPRSVSPRSEPGVSRHGHEQSRD